MTSEFKKPGLVFSATVVHKKEIEQEITEETEDKETETGFRAGLCLLLCSRHPWYCHAIRGHHSSVF